MKTIFKLLYLVKSFVWIILLAVINGVIGHLFSILISVLASLAIVKFLGFQVLMSYQMIIILMIIFGLVRGVLRYFEQYSNHFIAFKILAMIRHIIFKKVRELSPSFLDNNQSGDILMQITSDTETLEVFYAHTLSPVLIALFVNGSLVVFISVYTNVLLGMTLLFSYLLVGVLIPLIYYHFNKNIGKRYRKDLANYNIFFLDLIKGAKDIVFNNNQEIFQEEGLKYTSSLQKQNNQNHLRFTFVRSLVDLIIVIMSLVIIVIGVLFIKDLDKRLIIVGFITLLSSFGPIIALSNLPSNLTQTFASSKRLFKLLKQEKVHQENLDGKEIDFENLKIENLTFSYQDKQILNNLNLEIKKGEFIGIVGPSGCGKSTLLKLILGFYSYQGRIIFNGVDQKDILTKSLYQNVVMFSQSTYLFNDTIRNNLLIANPKASEEEIIIALKKASIYDFVMGLENGLDQIISENSSNISLGQKQRLGLARVFLAKPKLLLLDEATSNIDALNEAIILSSLKKQKGTISVIMISHKESTLQIVDKIYQMKDGGLYANF